MAVLLAYESKGLLVGESASTQTVADIKALAKIDPGVQEVMRVLTMHFDPQEVLLNLEIQFVKQLTAQELTEAVDRLEEKIRRQHPEVKHIFIEAKSLSASQKSSFQS